MKKIDSITKQFPEFRYQNYSWNVSKNNLIINFVFVVSDIIFSPQIIIENIDIEQFNKLDKKAIDNLVFHLGLAEIPSYWKAFCSPLITITAGYLSADQISWWKKLLISGMGQFYYENKINFKKRNFLDIKVVDKTNKARLAMAKGGKTLIPLGGGKDSSVTLEILSQKLTTGVFVLNETKAQKDVFLRSNCNNVIRVKRIIDPKLLELNTQGFLNGHTPFSSVIAFLSITASYLFGYKHVALSNEASSEEGNVEYFGSKINHQYSKSLEFEKDFQSYNNKYLSNIVYFSFLRPLLDVQISELFSTMDKYFEVFRSCNLGQKNDTWCGNCSKCLSTYILLYPFVDTNKIINLFGNDLFKSERLLTILKDLVVDHRVKPFECVGTREELKICLVYIIHNYKERLPLLLNWFKNNTPTKFDETRLDKLLKSNANSSNLPKNFDRLLKNYLKLPRSIRRISRAKVNILGFGIEGMSSYNYIRHYLPKKFLTISDKRVLNEFDLSVVKILTKDKYIKLNLGKTYLSNLKKYDFVIKSQGIPEVIEEISKSYLPYT